MDRERRAERGGRSQNGKLETDLKGKEVVGRFLGGGKKGTFRNMIYRREGLKLWGTGVNEAGQRTLKLRGWGGFSEQVPRTPLRREGGNGRQ